MENWFNKSEDEVLNVIKRQLEIDDDLIVVGKFVNSRGRDYFINIRNKNFVPLTYVGQGNKYIGNRIKVEIKEKHSYSLQNDWYEFKIKLAEESLRQYLNNPTLPTIDLSYEPKLYRPNEKEFVLNLYRRKAFQDLENDRNNIQSLKIIEKEINRVKEAFIYELLQNADDYPLPNSKVDVNISTTDNLFIFSHNGSPFRFNNVYALCNINDGDKQDDATKIGYKGIGFKSVFAYSEKVYIKSDKYFFKFDKKHSDFQRDKPFQIIPIWINNLIELKNLSFTDNVNIIIDPIDGSKKIEEWKILLNDIFLQDTSTPVTLFLRNIRNVYINRMLVSQNTREWWIREYKLYLSNEVKSEVQKQFETNTGNIPEKLVGANEIEIKFSLKHSNYKIIPLNEAIVYNYLPTKVNLGFSFLVNSDFIPTGDRHYLFENMWNKYLMKEVGRKFFEWLNTLYNIKHKPNEPEIFKKDYLILLPDLSENIQILKSKSSNNLFLLLAFKEGFDLSILGDENNAAIPFIPTQSGKLVTLSDIIIDETGLSDLLNDDFLRLTGLRGSLIHKDVGEGIEKVKKLIHEYQRGTIYNSDTLKDSFKLSNFQEWLKSTNNNFNLIKHLFFAKKRDLKELLISEEIILLQNGGLLKASEMYSSVPPEISFIENNCVNIELKKLLTKEAIELNLQPFNAINFYKANRNSINTYLTSANNILGFWNFIYDNWLLFKPESEIVNSLTQIKILCKPKQSGVLNIQPVSSAYISKELAKEDEVETILNTLNFDDKHFIVSNLCSPGRTDLKKWNEILKASKARSGLKDLITELISQLSSLNDAQHFTAGIEIFKYWKANKDKAETKLSEIQKATLQQTLKLKCNEGYIFANQCIISEHYSLDKRINEIIPGIILDNLITKDYQPYQALVSDWKQFFNFIGCVDLNSEQSIFNYKIDYLLKNQDALQADHFQIMKDLDQLTINSKLPVVFDYENKLSKIKLKTSFEKTWTSASMIHLPSEYKPTLDLQTDSEIQSHFKFLSPLYFSNNISKELLINLGVNENFSFKNISTSFSTFYPEILLSNTKYLVKFWKFLLEDNSRMKLLSTCNILPILKMGKTVEVENNVFKKPNELFSKNLEKYIADKSLIPLIDFSKYFINDSKTTTLEQLIGINQELSIQHCLEILQDPKSLSQIEVNTLNLISIIQKNHITAESINDIKLPDIYYNWVHRNRLYYSQDVEIINQNPGNLLHQDFQSIYSKIGVLKISISDYKKTFTIREASTADKELKARFKNRSEFIAFVLANGEDRFSEISEKLKTYINQKTFIECEELFDIITHGTLIWKRDKRFLEENSNIYFTEDLNSRKSEIRKYLYNSILQFGKISEKLFNRYVFEDSVEDIIHNLNDNYEIPEQWLKQITKNDNQFQNEVEQFIESLLEVEDIYDEEKVQELKSILADFKNQPDEKRKTFNLLAKLKLCKHLKLSYSQNWEFNEVIDNSDRYFIHSARGAFAYIHPNELIKMRDQGYKMAIDFGNLNIKIYESPEDLIELYNNYLILYQGKPNAQDILNLCSYAQNKPKFHFLILDSEKQTNDALSIIKILNNESYE